MKGSDQIVDPVLTKGSGSDCRSKKEGSVISLTPGNPWEPLGTPKNSQELTKSGWDTVTFKMQTGWDTGTLKMQTGWDTGTQKMRTIWDTGTLKMQTCVDRQTQKSWTNINQRT